MSGEQTTKSMTSGKEHYQETTKGTFILPQIDQMETLPLTHTMMVQNEDSLHNPVVSSDTMLISHLSGVERPQRDPNLSIEECKEGVPKHDTNRQVFRYHQGETAQESAAAKPIIIEPVTDITVEVKEKESSKVKIELCSWVPSMKVESSLLMKAHKVNYNVQNDEGPAVSHAPIIHVQSNLSTIPLAESPANENSGQKDDKIIAMPITELCEQKSTKSTEVTLSQKRPVENISPLKLSHNQSIMPVKEEGASSTETSRTYSKDSVQQTLQKQHLDLPSHVSQESAVNDAPALSLNNQNKRSIEMHGLCSKKNLTAECKDPVQQASCIQCNICGVNSKNILDYTNHLKFHSGDLNESLNNGTSVQESDALCMPKLNRRVSVVDQNIRNLLGVYHKLPFKCSVCLKAFTTQDGLDNHTLIHTQGRRLTQQVLTHKCTVCGQKFLTRAELQVHRKAEHPVCCQECGAKFINNYKLKMHMNSIHLGLKPFPCDLCSKSFGEASTMRVHRLTHTRKREFPCEKCGKVYSSQGTIKAHKCITTSCSTCNQTVICMRDLERHEKRKALGNCVKRHKSKSQSRIGSRKKGFTRCVMCLLWFHREEIEKHLWKCQVKRACLNRIDAEEVLTSCKSSPSKFTIQDDVSVTLDPVQNFKGEI